MKSATQILTLTTLVLVTIIITMVVSPANANKRYVVETGDIAFVDVFKLIDRALLSEDLANVREDFNIKSSDLIEGLKQQITELETELSGMQQGDPAAAAAYQQYQNLTAQFDSASQQISAAYQTLIAGQLASAYTEIYAAANEIGAQEGFVFVFATRSDSTLIQTTTITGITQEILARPLMTPPSGVDITELVRVQLGYPEKEPEPVIEAEEPVVPEAAEEAVDAPIETPSETPAETPVIEDD